MASQSQAAGCTDSTAPTNDRARLPIQPTVGRLRASRCRAPLHHSARPALPRTVAESLPGLRRGTAQAEPAREGCQAPAVPLITAPRMFWRRHYRAPFFFADMHRLVMHPYCILPGRLGRLVAPFNQTTRNATMPTTNPVQDALFAIADAKLIADMLNAGTYGDARPDYLMAQLSERLEAARAALSGGR